MIGRLLRVAAWLTCGAAVVFGLYWLLLNTPESNALALAASVALVLLMTAVTAMAVSAALGAAGGAGFGQSLAASVRGVHWILVAAVPAAVLWLAILRADRWVLDHSGEINAWFIARFGMADISGLLRAELWISRWLRWSLIPLGALALAGALRGGGAKGLLARWRRPLGWRAIAIAVLGFIVLIALPLPLVDWRPALPPTWVQPATAAARLGLVGVLWIAAASLLVLLATSSSSGGRTND